MKYKQLAEEREKELMRLTQEVEELKAEIEMSVEHLGRSLESDEAREVLRAFAAKANDRHELVLLVRALAKLPA